MCTVGTATMRLYLRNVAIQSSLYLLSLGSSALFKWNGSLGPVRMVLRALAGCTMVTFWSWMVAARMSTFTVRVLGWVESGRVSLFGGSGFIFPGALWVPGWCVACPHALRAHRFSPTRVLLGRRFFLWRLFWCCWEESCCWLWGFSLQELGGGCGFFLGALKCGPGQISFTEG